MLWNINVHKVPVPTILQTPFQEGDKVVINIE